MDKSLVSRFLTHNVKDNSLNQTTHLYHVKIHDRRTGENRQADRSTEPQI